MESKLDALFLSVIFLERAKMSMTLSDAARTFETEDNGYYCRLMVYWLEPCSVWKLRIWALVDLVQHTKQLSVLSKNIWAASLISTLHHRMSDEVLKLNPDFLLYILPTGKATHDCSKYFNYL